MKHSFGCLLEALRNALRRLINDICASERSDAAVKACAAVRLAEQAAESERGNWV